MDEKHEVATNGTETKQSHLHEPQHENNEPDQASMHVNHESEQVQRKKTLDQKNEQAEASVSKPQQKTNRANESQRQEQLPNVKEQPKAVAKLKPQVDPEDEPSEYQPETNQVSMACRNNNSSSNAGAQQSQVTRLPEIRQVAHKRTSFNLNGLPNMKMNVYDGLRDRNLRGHFASNLRRRHLIRMGLITKEGGVIKNPEDYLRKKELLLRTKDMVQNENEDFRSFTIERKIYNPYDVYSSQEKKATTQKGLTRDQFNSLLNKVESKFKDKIKAPQ